MCLPQHQQVSVLSELAEPPRFRPSDLAGAAPLAQLVELLNCGGSHPLADDALQLTVGELLQSVQGFPHRWRKIIGERERT